MDATMAERTEGTSPYNPENTERLVFHAPKALGADVVAYQRRRRIITKSEALRRLVTLALEVEAERDREERAAKRRRP